MLAEGGDRMAFHLRDSTLSVRYRCRDRISLRTHGRDNCSRRPLMQQQTAEQMDVMLG